MKQGTIFLMRHGETDMNRSERLQGHIDSELNETGKEEARRAASRLKSAGISFDAVYSSPLKRALRTAEIVADGAPVTVEPLIIEMSFGDFEGTPYRDIDAKMWDFIRSPETAPPPDGVESIKSLTERTGRFLHKLISDDSTGNVLVVTHGIALRSLLWNLYPENERSRVWGMPIENCIIYRLGVSDGKVTGVRRADELYEKNADDTSKVF
jgi:broad specificity phosphatase PhoE